MHEFFCVVVGVNGEWFSHYTVAFRGVVSFCASTLSP